MKYECTRFWQAFDRNKKNVQELHLIYFVWTIAGIDDVSAALLVSLQYENIFQKWSMYDKKCISSNVLLGEGSNNGFINLDLHSRHSL